jgi:hypothetical protein
MKPKQRKNTEFARSKRIERDTISHLKFLVGLQQLPFVERFIIAWNIITAADLRKAKEEAKCRIN